jgi:hypothetical protein
MKKITFILLVLIIQKNSFAQTYQWTKTIGGTYKEDSKCMAIDRSGNIYLCGRFSQTVDFDPGIGNYLLSTNNYYSSLFIEKLDSEGNFIWVKTFDQSSFDTDMDINAIATDSLNNIYFCGRYSGTIDFDPGIGTDYLSSAIYSSYIEKLDSNGNYNWAKSIGGGNGTIYGTNFNISKNGDLLIAGYFYDTVDFDPSISGINTFISNGNSDAFVLKLNSSGEFDWVKIFGSKNWDANVSLTTDNSNNIYLSGLFHDTVDFDPGPGTDFHFANSINSTSIYIEKLNTRGDFIWAKTFGNAYWAEGTSIVTDSNENTYLTGRFEEALDFDPDPVFIDYHYANGNYNGYDVFIEKLDKNGNYKWVKTFGGICDDIGYSIAISPLGYIYISGIFYATVDFDPSSIGTNFHSSNTQNNCSSLDAFVEILDSLGNFISVKTFGDYDPEYGLVFAKNMQISNKGSIYVYGEFENIVDFDPDNGKDICTSNGYSDLFLWKMSETNLSNIYETNFDQNLSVFPNPAQSILNIEYKGIGTIRSIKLYNVMGELMYEKYDVNFSEHYKIAIDFLNEGIYMMETTSEKEKFVSKVYIIQ